jgi:hypothetical protein
MIKTLTCWRPLPLGSASPHPRVPPPGFFAIRTSARTLGIPTGPRWVKYGCAASKIPRRAKRDRARISSWTAHTNNERLWLRAGFERSRVGYLDPFLSSIDGGDQVGQSYAGDWVTRFDQAAW